MVCMFSGSNQLEDCHDLRYELTGCRIPVVASVSSHV